MQLKSALMRTASFAHLPGFAAGKRRADDEDAKKRAPRDRPEADPRAGSDDEAKRAEKGEDDAKGDPEEEGSEDEAKKPDGKKKAARDEGDEDGADGRDGECDEDGDDESDEDEMRGKKGKRASAIRARERARCKAIFASPHAAANVQLAAHLAFETRLTRTEAVNTLKQATASAPSGSLAARMEAAATPRIPGAAAGSTDNKEAAIAKSWDQAFARQRR